MVNSKQFRCIVDRLSVRSQPRLDDQFKTNQFLKLDDRITVNASSRTEADGFVWWNHMQGWSAERSLDGGTIYLLDTLLQPKDKIWGLNIDPVNNYGNPQPPARLSGLGWVRLAFQVDSRKQSLEQTFAFYDPVIRAYKQAGIRVLMILLHDTYYGNAPWLHGDSGWDSYTQGFVGVVQRIAAHYAGQVAAYEIWNEGDLATETSVHVPPAAYGKLLQAAAQIIKLYDPAALVISGGLAGKDPVQYMKDVRSSLGGILPMDGIAIHPYGQTPPDVTPIPGWSTGAIDNTIRVFVSNFPRMPIWITEIGVPRVDVTNRSLWTGIANYMDKLFALIRGSYFNVVPALIWFAWSDPMDRAGIVTDTQAPKGILFDTFFKDVRADRAIYTNATPTPYDGRVMLTHAAGILVPDASIADLAVRINTSAPNVKGLILKTSVGAGWQGQLDTKPGMAINSTTDIARWSAELAKYRIDVHAWHEVRGADQANEVNRIVEVSGAPGVRSVILDLDPTTLALKTSAAIRAFMIALRQRLPTTYHLGLSFDSRRDQFLAVNMLEWYPFVNSWHPKVFHWLFSNGLQGPDLYLSSIFAALRTYPRPVIPMLQAAQTGGKPVPPDQIRWAGTQSFERFNAPAISYWQLGAFGIPEFGAIKNVFVPFTAGYRPLTALPPETLVVQINAQLRIRSAPAPDANTTGALQPGESIVVLERQQIPPVLWVRHARGWSACRNSDTGEVFLA